MHKCANNVLLLQESEGLLPEEDWTVSLLCMHSLSSQESSLNFTMHSYLLHVQVPGGYQDSLSSNTELGRAVQNACDELDNLSSLVMKPRHVFSSPVLISHALSGAFHVDQDSLCCRSRFV